MRVRSFSRLVLAAASILMLASAVQPAAAQDISIRQAWSRATPKGAQVAGGYLTIDHGAVPDLLISAASTVAAKVEIHEMTMLDGIMMMRSADDGLAIPPGASVTLAPGGNHLMFIGINAPFNEGEHIAAVLMFEKAGKIDVTFDVGNVGARGPRMIVASTEAAPPAISSPSADDFFIHICGTRVMANVTVSPGREGPVEIMVELEDANEQPLAAQALSVTLSNPDKPAVPLTVKAVRIAGDKWRARLPAAEAGKWSLALGIELATNDRIDIAAPILIEK